MSRQEKVIYALGFFDGVHKGHQAILETARQLARETGMRPGVFTYENHPQSVVGGSAPPLLTTPEERRALFAHYGMEEIVMIPFDAHFSAQSPEEFLRMLIEDYRCGGLCCGDNFHFGAKAAGNASLLLELCQKLGLFCRVASPVLEKGKTVSSTLIRTLLREGDAQEAFRCLGRPFSLAGEIVHGDGRGHRLGIPTINLTPPEGALWPRVGVYATLTQMEGGETWPSLTNVGMRPTFRAQGEATMETHLTGFQGNLYGRRVRVWFWAYLREEQKFENATLLVEQIARDTKKTQQLLQSLDRSDIYDLP